MVETLISVILSIITFGLGYWVGKRKRIPLSLEAARGAIAFRVAIHEAGHAIVKRNAPHITVGRIEIDEGLHLGQGRVSSRVVSKHKDDVEVLWWEVASLLGGLAGELIGTRKFRSGNCMQDANMARGMARDVVSRGALNPPWDKTDSKSSFDPVLMYRKGALSDEEAQVLRSAYAHAHRVILQDKERFDRLVHVLLERGSLNESEVQSVLQ